MHQSLQKINARHRHQRRRDDRPHHTIQPQHRYPQRIRARPQKPKYHIHTMFLFLPILPDRQRREMLQLATKVHF